MLKSWKIAFSGAPSSGKTTSIMLLEQIIKDKSVVNLNKIIFNYNTGRKLLNSISPNFRSDSFMTMIQSNNGEKISKFISKLIKIKREEVNSRLSVFTDKTLSDYMILLPMLIPNFNISKKFIQAANSQLNKFQIIFLLDPPINKDEYLRLPGRPLMTRQELSLMHNNLKNFFKSYKVKVIGIPRFPKVEDRVHHIISKLPTELKTLFKNN